MAYRNGSSVSCCEKSGAGSLAQAAATSATNTVSKMSRHNCLTMDPSIVVEDSPTAIANDSFAWNAESRNAVNER